jgi:zinc transport system substrate-binding protein
MTMKQMRFRIFCFFTLGVLTSLAGCGRQESAAVKHVAATNTYLECAAAELFESREGIMRLAGPGMCPGHFDIRPKQVEELRRCRILLRFDFQKGLDAKLTGVAENGLQIIEVRVTGGLGEPKNFLETCRQVGEALVAANLLEAKRRDLRLAAIEKSLNDLSAWTKSQITAAKLEGTPVIASMHQADFCRSLGLKVVAGFSGPDTSGILAIDEAVQSGQSAGVKLIVGNEPEGRSVADALADRLGAKVVLLKNFPELDERASFETMVRENVNRLCGGGTR